MKNKTQIINNLVNFLQNFKYELFKTTDLLINALSQILEMVKDDE